MTLAAARAGKRKNRLVAEAKSRNSPRREDHDGWRGTRPDPKALLAWYDRHRRELPWRAPVGVRAAPYRVWISEIMLQQTRAETVARYYRRFLRRFPTLRALAAARLDSVLKEWAGLGYYARARNLHACARRLVREYGGRFPRTQTDLRALPGIGAYSAAAIAAIAFGERAAAVDGNVERVMARLCSIDVPLPAARADLRRRVAALVPERRPGDFAQALIELGATVCLPRRPDCPACPWRAACAAARRGDPERFPRRAPKPNGRIRRGEVFLVTREDGAVLLRRRPRNGLLGGMLEVPGTEWRARSNGGALQAAPDLPVSWRRMPGTVEHVFSHFRLRLVVHAACAPVRTPAPAGMRFIRPSRLAGEALAALTRKVIAHANAAMAEIFTPLR